MGLGDCLTDGWINPLTDPKIASKTGKFYGMELPWVGAFTEKWGSGYRNPVHFWGFFLKIRQNRDSRGWCSIVMDSRGFLFKIINLMA